MFNLDLEKVEETEVKLPTPIGSLEKKENTRKTSTSALLIKATPLTVTVQFSCSVMSNSLQPHGLQYTRLPCPSPLSSLLPELTQTHVYQVSDAIQPSHPLLSPSTPAFIFFSNELVLCIRWPKNWSFSFSISPSNEYSGLISFRMDWLDFSAVQGTLKSLLQPTTVQKHQFFGAQLSL